MFFRKLIPLLLLLTLPSQVFARSYVDHLGLGVSTQLINDVPSISIKNYTSDSFAWGLLGNFSTADTTGGWGVGGKLYKNFFAEPQLFFFASLLFAIVNSKKHSDGDGSQTGIQADLTAGSEFFIPGLESLGFSFETGLSINTLNEFVIETTAGSAFIAGAIHFYL